MVAATIYLISPWVPLSVPGSSRTLNVAEKLPQYVGWFCREIFAVDATLFVGTAWLDVVDRCTGVRGRVRGIYAHGSTHTVLTGVCSKRRLQRLGGHYF